MSDFHEQDTWDQDEVEIVDLGTPEKGLSRYFFTLGEKWCAAASLPVKLGALVVALSLLIAVLLPGSSLVNNRTPGAHHTVPAYALPYTIIIYSIDCATAISTTSGQGFTLPQFLPTAPAQRCSISSRPVSHCPSWQTLFTSSSQGWVIACSAGTPLPVPSGNDGKHP